VTQFLPTVVGVRRSAFKMIGMHVPCRKANLQHFRDNGSFRAYLKWCGGKVQMNNKNCCAEDAKLQENSQENSDTHTKETCTVLNSTKPGNNAGRRQARGHNTVTTLNARA